MKISGFKVENYESLDSTQNRIKEIYKKKPRPAVVIADMQTASYGRRTKQWISVPGGLYCSILLKSDDFNSLMSINALEAVVKALKEQNILVNWKWPNDLIYKGKKLGGILTEHYGSNYYAIGVGINSFIKLPQAISEIASNYSKINREQFILDLVKELEKLKNRKILSKANRKSLEETQTYIGEWINVDGRCGILKGITDTGQLRMKYRSKNISINSGSVIKVKYEELPQKHCFLVDIGNTKSKISYMSSDFDFKTINIATRPYRGFNRRFFAELSVFSKFFSDPIDSIAVSSVVEPVSKALIPVLTKKFKSVVNINFKNAIGLDIKLSSPQSIGADRICNAVAANSIYGGDVVVLDFGTANTFDIVSKNAEYIGGVIAPGLDIMVSALNEKTDKLDLKKFKIPAEVIGKNTSQAMNSGLFYTVVGQIKAILSELSKQTNSDFKVIVTGGAAEVFRQFYSADTILDRDLTLKGLAILVKRITKT